MKEIRTTNTLSLAREVNLRRPILSSPPDLREKSLESWFPDVRINNDKDPVKLTLVYLATSLLLNNNPTVVLPEFFVNLVDNMENFNNCPWGKVVWEDSTTRIKKTSTK